MAPDALVLRVLGSPEAAACPALKDMATEAVTWQAVAPALRAQVRLRFLNATQCTPRAGGGGGGGAAARQPSGGAGGGGKGSAAGRAGGVRVPPLKLDRLTLGGGADARRAADKGYGAADAEGETRFAQLRALESRNDRGVALLVSAGMIDAGFAPPPPTSFVLCSLSLSLSLSAVIIHEIVVLHLCSESRVGVM